MRHGPIGVVVTKRKKIHIWGSPLRVIYFILLFISFVFSFIYLRVIYLFILISYLFTGYGRLYGLRLTGYGLRVIYLFIYLRVTGGFTGYG